MPNLGPATEWREEIPSPREIEQEPPRPRKPVQAGLDQSVRSSSRVELQATASSAVKGQPSGTPQREPKNQVLIVDDDAAFARQIKTYLEREGYGASAVRSAAGMRDAIETGTVDLIILNVMLRNEDGWSALRWIRARVEIPVLMLTDKRDTVDKVIELGAQDHIAKPLDLCELRAWLCRVQRRAEQPPPDAGPAAEGVLRFPGWALDPSSQRLTTETGQPVHLTRIEYRILVLLVRHPRRTITRDQLMASAIGRNWEPFDRNIDVHISNLRRKLDLDPKLPSLIRTVRGAGYMFVPGRGA